MIQLRPMVSADAFKRLNEVATEYGVEPSTVAARIIEQACKTSAPEPKRVEPQPRPRVQITAPAEPTKTQLRVTALRSEIAELDALNYSKTEIAKALNVSLGTIYNHYTQALQLRKGTNT